MLLEKLVGVEVCWCKCFVVSKWLVYMLHLRVQVYAKACWCENWLEECFAQLRQTLKSKTRNMLQLHLYWGS